MNAAQRKGLSIKFSAIASGGVPSSFPSTRTPIYLDPTSQFHSTIEARLQHPVMADPDGSSGGGGYYTYQCCYWNEQNCGGWVYQNGDACAQCQVCRKSISPPFTDISSQAKGLPSKRSGFPSNQPPEDVYTRVSGEDMFCGVSSRFKPIRPYLFNGSLRVSEHPGILKE